MKTTKTFLTLLFFSFLLIIVSCKKETNIKKETSKIEKDTLNYNLSNEQYLVFYDKITSINFLSEIPDTTAKEYMTKYNDVCDDNTKFPSSFFINSFAYNEILQKSNGKDILLEFTEIDGKLSLLYKVNDQYYKIVRFNRLQSITIDEYNKLSDAFKKNVYNTMNSKISDLSGRTINKNTNLINIPFQDFEKCKPSKNLQGVLIFPGIVTKDFIRNGKNYKNYINIILHKINIEVFRLNGESYYDTFCLTPPDKC